MIKKVALILVSIALLAALVCQLTQHTRAPAQSNNVSIVDGQQVVKITVSESAYLPSQTLASADLPTVLQFDSEGNYGCTRTLIIESLNFQKTLPITGVAKIDLGKPNVNQKVDGVCGMGMARFTVKFQ